jgi:hypothetical protein
MIVWPSFAMMRSPTPLTGRTVSIQRRLLVVVLPDRIRHVTSPSLDGHGLAGQDGAVTRKRAARPTSAVQRCDTHSSRLTTTAIHFTNTAAINSNSFW